MYDQNNLRLTSYTFHKVGVFELLSSSNSFPRLQFNSLVLVGLNGKTSVIPQQAQLSV